MFCLYILHSTKTGRYYIGSCADISQRFHQHNSGSVRSTKFHLPTAYSVTTLRIFSDVSRSARNNIAFSTSNIQRKNMKSLCPKLLHRWKKEENTVSFFPLGFLIFHIRRLPLTNFPH